MIQFNEPSVLLRESQIKTIYRLSQYTIYQMSVAKTSSHQYQSMESIGVPLISRGHLEIYHDLIRIDRRSSILLNFCRPVLI